MGVRESDAESETAEEISFDQGDSVDGDSYIEIDLQRSASTAENRGADTDFEFRLSVSSPMRANSHHLPADMLFCNGRLLPLHCIVSPDGDGGSPCPEDGTQTENKKEESLGAGQTLEMRRRPESGRRALSFRKSSKVGAEEEHEIRKPMDNPEDLELTTVRDQYYKGALTVGKLPESTATGLEKLLMMLRTRVSRDVRGQTSHSFYGHRPSRRDTRIRKAKEIIDKCWRIVNPFQAHRGRREEEEGAAASSESGRSRRLFAGGVGASCREVSGVRSCREVSGVRSCPTSLGSSPIHWRVNSFAYARELSLRDRDCSVQAAIAHCKNSNISDAVVK
ncbi:hypothetical protein EJ110_NYTH09162 [Nymphaea thermarum]|nr:hypothetical protein EJ110_NYTH09162 [Nymphaea thermarum]